MASLPSEGMAFNFIPPFNPALSTKQCAWKESSSVRLFHACAVQCSVRSCKTHSGVELAHPATYLGVSLTIRLRAAWVQAQCMGSGEKKPTTPAPLWDGGSTVSQEPSGRLAPTDSSPSLLCSAHLHCLLLDSNLGSRSHQYGGPAPSGREQVQDCKPWGPGGDSGPFPCDPSGPPRPQVLYTERITNIHFKAWL